MDLQRDAQQNARNADRMAWVLLFAIFTKILIPVIRHSIKHRWIFALLGAIVSGIIHGLLYEAITNFNHWFSLPIYAIFLTLGIYLTIIIRRRKHTKSYGYGSPTNPYEPHELYYDDER